MARNRKPGKPIQNKDYNGPFPLQDDKVFLALTVKQQKFVYNVFLQPVSGWTNSKCYAEAYGTEINDNAYTASTDNLRKPKIVYCIDKLRSSYMEALGYNAERILNEVGALATSDIAEYFDEDGYLLINPKDLPTRARKAISSFTKSYDEFRNPRWKVSLWSKPDALKMMINLNNMGTAKKIELSGPGGGPIEHHVVNSVDLSDLDTDELEVLYKLISKKGAGEI